MYTDDVEHDVVGALHGPLTGRDAARGFYEQLTREIDTESMTPTRRYHGPDFCVTEHQWTGTVQGAFLGIPGHGRRVSFRMLHLWEFSDGRISRENLWLDGGSAAAQLSAPVDP
jgi:predicted ester cyclase